MSAAPAVLLGRCNPYGAETGGPQRILGGLHGPASAALPDAPEYAGIPTNVMQGEWTCQQPAQIRCRMICKCQHKGQVMQLCETIRHHGHFEEIQKRQAGSCPRCLFPAGYADLYKEIQAWQGELAVLFAAQRWRSPRAQMLRQAIEDGGKVFDEGRALGVIHNCPLTLVPVS